MKRTESQPGDRELLIIIPEHHEPVAAFIEGASALAEDLGLAFSEVVNALLVEKAVPAHHSQFQARSGGRFRHQARYKQGEGGIERIHPSEHQPRDLRGRFMRRLDDAEQKEAAEQASRWVGQLDTRLQRHLFDYESGHVSSSEWVDRCGEDIEHFYELCYRSGKQAAGDPAVKLSGTDRAIINRLVRDEMDYLRGFGDDMDAGNGRMPYHARMHLYAQAARESFWNGWVTGDLRTGRAIRWVFGPTEEHCTDCSRFVEMSWVSAFEFYHRILAKGFAPQSGQLECQGHRCACMLQERYNGVVRTPNLTW